MIPDWDNKGNLPPGVWTASIEEIEKRCATSENRRLLFRGFKQVIELLQAASCPEVFLNGSYVTSAATPGDYDLCYEWNGMQAAESLHAFLTMTAEERKRIYFGDIFVRMPSPPFFFDHVEEWQKDRDGEIKGILRIDLRTAHD